jgi:Protein of unknown function (DUF1566)
MAPSTDTIPWTGQTSCHDAAGNGIPCAGSGQDAEFRAGAPWPEPRFVVSGAEVLDRLTDLVWARDANSTLLPVTWREAFEHVATMNGGRPNHAQGWRLPNRRELRSLMSHETRRPALPAGHPFVNVWSGWYWTSTTAAIHPAYAWYVHMEGARTFYGRKDEDHLLWPVRGDGNGLLAATGQTLCHDSTGRLLACAETGQDGEYRAGRPWPDPRFEVAGDVVLDRLTDLIWTRSADVARGEVSWTEALASASLVAHQLRGSQGPRMGASACTARCNWRLPNILELESLVDCSMHSPALPRDHPFSNLREDYWSSTTSMFEPDWAWALYLSKGAVGVGQKKARCFSVWAVCDRISGHDLCSSRSS